MIESKYGISRSLPGVTFQDALSRVRESLAKEGFGVLSEIDVKATMKKKLGLDFGDYVILGACNAPLAHMALTGEPALGLLLPCNIVVAVDPEGRTEVGAIDPVAMFSVVDRADIAPIAADVRARLERVIAAV